MALAAAGAHGERPLSLAELFGRTELPFAGALFVTAVFGLAVGSFLGAAAYRLPEGLSLMRPARSFCPSCRKQLAWFENLPVLSWVWQRGRCRGCDVAVPWRYPAIELATALAWVLVVWIGRDAPWPLVAVHLLVISGLVLATAVDFERFEIPDEVSIGGIAVAPFLSLAVPSLHSASPVAQALTLGWEAGEPVSRAGALASSLLGIAVGGGVLLAIGWVGKRAFGREAMGLGDVKLLAAAGGFIGGGGALLALLLGSLAASVAGALNLVRFTCFVRRRARARGGRRPLGRALVVGRIAARYLPFGPYLAMGIAACLLFWEPLLQWLRRTQGWE